MLARLVDRWGSEAVFGRDGVALSTLVAMGVLENAYRLVRRLRNAKGDEIHQFSADDMAMIAEFREEGWL